MHFVPYRWTAWHEVKMMAAAGWIEYEFDDIR